MEIRELFADLLGKEVTFEPAPPFAPGPNTPAAVAVYTDDSLLVRALICLDLPLAAYAGAAIGLVPVTGAETAIEERKVEGTLHENLAEVFNIATSLFNKQGHTHLKLYAVHPAGGGLPADVQARALTLGRREDARITVGGYGTGRLSIVLC
jgi:hypothetical protein